MVVVVLNLRTSNLSSMEILEEGESMEGHTLDCYCWLLRMWVRVRGEWDFILTF